MRRFRNVTSRLGMCIVLLEITLGKIVFYTDYEPYMI